jgi:ABC-type branched-subunit amino acid transport system substrate-binding protein
MGISTSQVALAPTMRAGKVPIIGTYKYGGTATAVTMKVTAVDVTPQVQAIIAQKPDIITIYGINNTSMLTMKTLAQYGLKIPTFGITYLGAP